MNYSNQVQIHNRKKTDDRMFCSSSNKYKMKKNIDWDMDWFGIRMGYEWDGWHG